MSEESRASPPEAVAAGSSTSTASTSTATSATSAASSGTVATFKVPHAPPSTQRRRRQIKVKVLEEEEYADKVSAIIERDFFPELEKLKAKSEFIDATDSNDGDTIRRLQERFSTSRIRHRPATDEISRLSTPSTFETPPLRKKEDDSRPHPAAAAAVNEGADDVDDVGADEMADNDEVESQARPKESLDRFLAKHTSEDNESFNDLMDESHEIFAQNHAWMFKREEQLSLETKAAQLALPSPEEQANQLSAAGKQKASQPLEGWTYKNVNAVFYNPDGVDYTKEEMIELAKKERKIVHENTRFESSPWKSEVQSEGVLKTMLAKKEASLGKVGADGKDIVDQKSPSINGYKLMRIGDATPQIDPSESPMMTWGQVESTPYRLEGCETPLLSSAKEGAPSFTMQAVPKRDRLALQLAEKNSKFHRDKKGKAIQKVRSNFKTPSERRSMTDKISAMSPAAQRLASSKLGIRVATDSIASSAYSPRTPRLGSGGTPRIGGGGTPSSLGSTPRSKDQKRRLLAISSSVRRCGDTGSRTPAKATPKSILSSPAPAATTASSIVNKHKQLLPTDQDSLTDNLLNLPSTSSSSSADSKNSEGSKRSKASDFF